MLSAHELLRVIEEGVANGRIAPHLATYIAAELQISEARAGDYEEPRASAEETSR